MPNSPFMIIAQRGIQLITLEEKGVLPALKSYIVTG
jgi:hypothetical protein